MENKPLVTIITPTYNRKNLIGRTILSIVKQTYDNIEHIIVNDGGEDVSDVIEVVAGTYPEKAKRIKYINKPKNEGVSAARNSALERAHGDYICLLDDDDIYYPLAVEFRLWAMEKFNADVVYTKALRDIWEVSEGGYVSIGKDLYWECSFDKDLILIQNVANSECVTFSRRAWDKTGNYLFDPQIKYCEDYDFWVALSRENDFYELSLIDAESSIRPADQNQITGHRDFSEGHIAIYKKWRHTARDLKFVTKAQNEVLLSMGKNPEDYGL